MSPVYRDESSGDAFSDPGRPLTRKELRAREKLLATQGHDAVPPQTYAQEPVLDAPEIPELPTDAPQVPELPTDAPQVPAIPPELPSVQDDEPQMGPEHQNEPVYQNEPVHAAGPVQPADYLHHDEVLYRDGALQDDELHYDELQQDELLHHDETGALVHVGEPLAAHHTDAHGAAYATNSLHHPDHEFAEPAELEVHDHHVVEDHYDEAAHHLYEEADLHPLEDHGHPLMAGASVAKKGPSKKVRRRRRFLALLLTLAVFVTALVVGAQFLKPLLGMDKVADYPGPGTGQVSFTVQPGEGVRSVATRLESEKVIANADTFAAAFDEAKGTLNPGDFVFRQEMKASDAVAILVGKEQSKVLYFALSAGLRINESLQAIADGSGIAVADLKALSDSPAQFGVAAKAKNLEGYLAPGEYRFPVGTSAKEILQKLVGSTLDELKAQGVTDPDKQYDVLTVASIVQAEGGQADYGDVAGAIYNRLKPNNTETNGLIQSDATVTYGLGIKSFHLDDAQKADKSNPYNTYANPGLPVGPIGSPGKTAIDAAAKPKTNDYLYWVTINLDTGETKFSKTLAQHLVYVEQYNQWCAANAGRCV